MAKKKAPHSYRADLLRRAAHQRQSERPQSISEADRLALKLLNDPRDDETLERRMRDPKMERPSEPRNADALHHEVMRALSRQVGRPRGHSPKTAQQRAQFALELNEACDRVLSNNRALTKENAAEELNTTERTLDNWLMDHGLNKQWMRIKRDAKTRKENPLD